MNTKKISELTALEQVTEQTYLLVEQDGKACRLPISVLSEHLGTTGGNDNADGDNDNTEEKELITFTLYGKECQAEEGMTWQEWSESEYNTPVTEFGYVSIYNGYLNYEDYLFETEDRDFVTAGDTINAGATYSLSKYNVFLDIPTVKFFIGGKLFRTTEGMTWQEWADSEHNENHIRFDYSEGYARYAEMVVHDGNGEVVRENDVIVDGHAYTIGDEEIGLISFNIGDYTQLCAIDGMTWEEFVNVIGSSGSGGEVSIDEGGVMWEGIYLYTKNGTKQYGSTVIEDGASYDYVITFSIGETECQATSGMTWQEWVDSAFNNYITTITIVDDGIYAQEWDSYLEQDNMVRAYGDTVIVSGHTYYWA